MPICIPLSNQTHRQPPPAPLRLMIVKRLRPSGGVLVAAAQVTPAKASALQLSHNLLLSVANNTSSSSSTAVSLLATAVKKPSLFGLYANDEHCIECFHAANTAGSRWRSRHLFTLLLFARHTRTRMGRTDSPDMLNWLQSGTQCDSKRIRRDQMSRGGMAQGGTMEPCCEIVRPPMTVPSIA